jgi:hypothetical protein
MVNKLYVAVLAITLASLLTPATSQAVPISQTLHFTAYGLEPFAGAEITIPSIGGQFTITADPATQEVGWLDDIDLVINGNAFAKAAYLSRDGDILIESHCTDMACRLTSAKSLFVLRIRDWAGATPILDLFAFSATASPGYWATRTGLVSHAGVAGAAIPLPASFPIGLTAIVGATLIGWNKARRTA